MDMNQMTSRLGDSALRKMQKSMNPLAPQHELSQRSSQAKGLKVAAIGGASYLSKVTMAASQLDKAAAHLSQPHTLAA